MGKTIELTKTKTGYQSYRTEMIEYFNCYYIDASRDFSVEMKDTKSYFARSTKSINMSDQLKQELESQLSDVNTKMVDSIDEIKETNKILSEIAPVVGIKESSVIVQPIARNVDDLHRGLDVIINDDNSLSLSISKYGMGTKSWVSFLSLKAFVNYFNNVLKKNNPKANPYYMLLLEEPEAHLHPQAQKQLYDQLKSFNNQRIVSTHSQSILSQCDPENIIYIDRKEGITNSIRFTDIQFEKKSNEVLKVKREILKHKGELFFSNYVILCEGITEEQELPVFFEKKFSHSPSYYGVSIVCVNGVNYASFVKLFNAFSIKWAILSDGETQTLSSLKGIFNKKSIDDLANVDNLFYYDNEDDIEKYLIRSGYTEEIKNAVYSIVGGKEKYIADLFKNPVKKEVEKEIGEVCPSCNRKKIEKVKVEMYNLSDEDYELYKYITRKNGKALFSEEIAYSISKSEKCIPDVINNLFEKIKKDLNIT